MKLFPVLRVRTALLVTTLAALVPALVIIVMTGLEHGRYREQEMLAAAHRQVEAVTSIHNESIASLRRLLETLAALPAFREQRYEDQTEILREIMATDPPVFSIAATDVRGHVRASSELPPGTDFSQRKHVRDALKYGAFSPGEYILARIDGIPAFPFAFPLRDTSGEITGALATVFSLETYADLFHRLDLEEDTILAITDHRGIRLFYYPPRETNPPGVAISANAWEIMSSGGDSGMAATKGSDGVVRYHAYRRIFTESIGEPYLYIVVGYPADRAAGRAREILARNLLLMIAVVILAVALAILLGDIVFGRRFHQLATAAFEVSHGRFETRTGIPPGRSEVSQLARAIDRMAARLSARDREKEAEALRLARLVGEKDVLLREVHHRVKNNMQMILSIVNLQRGTMSDPETFCNELETRISSMAAVHEQLYRSSDVSTIEAESLLQNLADSASTMYNGSLIRPDITVTCEKIDLHLDHAIPLALITGELITNACKYAPDDNGDLTVDVRFFRSEDDLVLVCRDSGPGIPPGVSGRRGGWSDNGGNAPGLGLSLVGALAAQLGGECVVEGYVTVRFPAI
jgi:two-component sensor histidine kinase